MAPQQTYNTGTILKSGFDESGDNKWFMYSTMISPLDGQQHPVSGNRRFGIYPDNTNGGYTLYIMGVDRARDDFTSWMQENFNVVFSGADQLWNSVIKGAKNYVNQHGGSAENYTQNGAFNRRLGWDGPVGQFLRKQITLQDLKTAFDCP